VISFRTASFPIGRVRAH